MPPDAVRAAVAALAADGLAEERWFGGKGEELGPLELLGALGPRGDEWLLALGVGVDAYLVPALLRDGRVVEAEGPLWRALADACLDGETLAGEASSSAAPPARPRRPPPSARSGRWGSTSRTRPSSSTRGSCSSATGGSRPAAIRRSS